LSNFKRAAPLVSFEKFDHPALYLSFIFFERESSHIISDVTQKKGEVFFQINKQTAFIPQETN